MLPSSKLSGLLLAIVVLTAVSASPSLAVGPSAAELLLIGQLPFGQNLSLVAMQVIIATWIFVLGACFGSFLNVVIYRLPAGMSLGKPKSRCPQCETPLAARDNIPVIGWLLLRGKCRYCGLPIAARYPVIEAICGSVFLMLLFGELLTGAANLPMRHPDHFHVNPGFWLVWFTKWDLSGLYLFHCCLLITVLATVMIGFDGHRPQRKIVVFGLLTALLCGTVWTELRPVPAFVYPDRLIAMNAGFYWGDPVFAHGSRYWTGVSLTGLLDGIAGVCGGLLFGWLALWPARSSMIRASQTSLAAIASAFVITGAFLGWQACGMLAMFTLPLVTLAMCLTRSSKRVQGIRYAAPGFFVLTVVFVLLWNFLDNSAWMIGVDGWQFTAAPWWLDWLMTVVALAIIGGLVRYFALCSDGDNHEVPDPLELSEDS